MSTSRSSDGDGVLQRRAIALIALTNVVLPRGIKVPYSGPSRYVGFRVSKLIAGCAASRHGV